MTRKRKGAPRKRKGAPRKRTAKQPTSINITSKGGRVYIAADFPADGFNDVIETLRNQILGPSAKRARMSKALRAQIQAIQATPLSGIGVAPWPAPSFNTATAGGAPVPPPSPLVSDDDDDTGPNGLG